MKPIFLSRRTIVEKSERKAVFLVKLSFWRIFVEAKQFLVRNVERREERFLVVISTSSSSSSSPAITLHNSPPALFPHTSPFFLTSFSSSSFCSNFIRGYSEDVSDGIHDGARCPVAGCYFQLLVPIYHHHRDYNDYDDDDDDDDDDEDDDDDDDEDDGDDDYRWYGH